MCGASPHKLACLRRQRKSGGCSPTSFHLTWLSAVVISSLLLLGAAWAAAQQAPRSDLGTLEIATRNGVRVFSVEMAVTDEQRSRGLMYRKELPEDHGMLFEFTPEQEVTMWMKNTYVSLDMIFIRKDGRVHRIVERTEPLSTRVISSGGPVHAVFEVVAGTAKKLGIGPGDRVSHPIFQGR